jgi:hypothetical protein
MYVDTAQCRVVQRQLVQRQVVQRQVVQWQVVQRQLVLWQLVSYGNSSHELGRRKAARPMNWVVE